MTTTVEHLQRLAADARAHPCNEAFSALVAATDQFNATQKALDPEHLPGFVCPLCGGFFYVDPGHTREDREREFRKDIPVHMQNDSRVTVCSSCYANVLKWMEEKGLTPS